MRLRLALLGLVLAVGLAVVAAVTVILPSAAATGSWTYMWRESFTGRAGSGVNLKYWEFNLGRGIFGNGEVETMTDAPANAHLDGRGDLDLTALDDGGWTSARIQTRSSSFAAPPGGELRVVADIEQPSAHPGLGYWPAFWLLGPGSWPRDGEIDVLEDVNSLSDHSGALHCGNLTVTNADGTFGPCDEYVGFSSGMLPCPGCQSGFNTYSVTIDRRDPADQEIRWYLDGHQFFAVTEKQVGASVWRPAVDHGFSIIFDLAIGGTYPNNTCRCGTPTAQTVGGGTMKIRYLRVSVWRPRTGH